MSPRPFEVLLVGCLLVLLHASTPLAQQPADVEERLLFDNWAVTVLDGEENGWGHTWLVERRTPQGLIYCEYYEDADRSLVAGNVLENRSYGWTLENEKGELTRKYMRDTTGGETTITELVVQGTRAAVTTTSLGVSRIHVVELEEPLPGNEAVRRIRREAGTEPGTTFSYPHFNIFERAVTEETVTVLGTEDVPMLDGTTERLLHIIETSSSAPKQKSHIWLDDDFWFRKFALDLGPVDFEFYATTEERARRALHTPLVKDAYEALCITCDPRVPDVFPAEEVRYLIVPEEPDLPLPDGMLSDPRQRIISREEGEVVLEVATRIPAPGQPRSPLVAPPEVLACLEPNAVIQNDHPALKAKAIELVGEEVDAWVAACLLEEFVAGHVTDTDNADGFGSAAYVFESRRGTCSEMAVLLAAMARAVGIPARLAGGFLHTRGMLEPHAWTEVWIGDGWYALDATLNTARVGPGHIRTSVHSYRDGEAADGDDSNYLASKLGIRIAEVHARGRVFSAEDWSAVETTGGNAYRNELYGVGMTLPEGLWFSDLTAFEPDDWLAWIRGGPEIVVWSTPLRRPAEMIADLEATGWEVPSASPRVVSGVEGTLCELRSDYSVGVAFMISHRHMSFAFIAQTRSGTDLNAERFEEVLRGVVLD